MHHLKNICDLFFTGLWGVSLMKILPLVANQGTAVVFPQLDRGLSISVTVLGIVYGIVRMVISIRKARQDERFREQEIIEKQNNNFYKKWDKEFL